jgi:formylglycine-generating enzyme required for sulfatase activity
MLKRIALIERVVDYWCFTRLFWRRPNGCMYPWGDEFDKDKCNTIEGGKGGTTPVGSYKAGESFYGASDMIGNVWEVTQGFQGSLGALGALWLIVIFVIFTVLEGSGTISPLITAILSALLGASVPTLSHRALRTFRELKIFRGGAWYNKSDEATCFYRDYVPGLDLSWGFRCVKEV